MTAHRINHNNRVGFGIKLNNDMWKCRFAGGEVRLIHKNNLTIFSERPDAHSYMDKRDLSYATAKKLFNL